MQTTSESPATKPLEPQGPARVLVVDDDVMLQDLLKSILEAFGMTVIGIANNGAEACELFANLAPDAVVMDIRMPVMDGLEALRRIRAKDPNALVMMISAGHEDESERRAVELGCQGFLRKPFQVEDLFGALNRGLRKLWARRQGIELDQHYIRYVLKERLGEPESPKAPRVRFHATPSGRDAATMDEAAAEPGGSGPVPPAPSSPPSGLGPLPGPALAPAAVAEERDVLSLRRENTRLRTRLLQVETTLDEILDLLTRIKRQG